MLGPKQSGGDTNGMTRDWRERCIELIDFDPMVVEKEENMFIVEAPMSHLVEDPIWRKVKV